VIEASILGWRTASEGGPHKSKAKMKSGQPLQKAKSQGQATHPTLIEERTGF
jgi:hypothetical protein